MRIINANNTVGEHVCIFVIPRTSTKAIHHRFDLQDKRLSNVMILYDMIWYAIYIYYAFNNICVTSIYCCLINVANAIFFPFDWENGILFFVAQVYIVSSFPLAQSLAISQFLYNGESIPWKWLFFSTIGLYLVIGLSNKKKHLENRAQLRYIYTAHFESVNGVFPLVFANANVK